MVHPENKEIPAIPLDMEFSGLETRDFHLFEDGAEQPLRSLSVEPMRFWRIDDSGESSLTRETIQEYKAYYSLAKEALFATPPTPGLKRLWGPSPGSPCKPSHMEYASTPRGFWSGRDICFGSSGFDVMVDSSGILGAIESYPAKDSKAGQLHLYLISYVPPPSVEGSCHQIKVTVDRSGASVYARSQYCNVHKSPSDPLKGTKAGEQMEGEQSSTQEGKLPLSVQAVPTFSEAGTSRVNIAVEFPWRALTAYWDGNFRAADVDLLGLVYNQDGSLATRFSDVAYSPKAFDFHKANRLWNLRDVLAKELLESRLPTRYETQIDLPPGNYTLRIVVTDGKNFGRAELPVKVDSIDPKNLAVSGIVLGKRFVDMASVWPQPAPDKDTAGQANLPKRELSTAPEYVPLVSNEIGITPAGDTGVPVGDQLLTYFEVHEPLLVAGQVKVGFRMRVMDAKTGQLQMGTDWRSTDAPARPEGSIIPIVQGIGTDKLLKGAYRLEVQASDSAGRQTVWRTASFTVE